MNRILISLLNLRSILGKLVSGNRYQGNNFFCFLDCSNFAWQRKALCFILERMQRYAECKRTLSLDLTTDYFYLWGYLKDKLTKQFHPLLNDCKTTYITYTISIIKQTVNRKTLLSEKSFSSGQSNGLRKHHCCCCPHWTAVHVNLIAAGYNEILCQQVVPFLQCYPNTVLQHNNARTHMARTVTVYGEEQNIFRLPTVVLPTHVTSYRSSMFGTRWRAVWPG